MVINQVFLFKIQTNIKYCMLQILNNIFLKIK